MANHRSLVVRVVLVAGLLTQTSGNHWPTAEAAVSTGRPATIIPALISPLQSPVAAPDGSPATGQTSPDAGGGAPIRLQVDFESRAVRNNQSLHGALRAEWQGGHGEVAPATAFTATMDFPTGLDYMSGSSAAQYDAAQRRLTWPNVQLDAGNQLVLPFQATVAVLDTPARLAVQAGAQGVGGVRFLARPAQLNVSRTTPGQVVSARSGGQFQTASGRVRLDFSQDAIPAETVVITGEEYEAMPPSALMPGISPANWKSMAKTAYQDSFGSDPQQSLDNDIARLSLADPLLKVDFYPSMVFSRPVTATFELGGQIAQELAASGLMPVLQYVIKTPFTSTYQVSPTLSVVITNTRRTFEEVPSWYDPDTGRLTAFIGHFSTYEVTVDSQLPKPWKMVSNLGEMNIFRGAYNYSYPLEVPPMQDGLAPKLALSYSSAKADYDGSLETLGHGWSLDIPRVTRKLQQTAYVSTNYYPIEQGPNNGNCPHPVNADWCWYVVGSYDTISGYQLQYEDKFSLSFGGQDMYLVQKSSSVSEFVTLNYTPLRIYRCSNTINCGGAVVSNTNASGEYWQVWTPDGVRYVFGTDQLSEARLNQTSPTAATVTQAWYLKAVFAPYRDDPSPSVNRASAQYFYQQKTDAGGAYQTNLTEVDYGNRLRPDGSVVGTQYSVTLAYVERTARVSQPLTVTVREEGNTLRQYLLAYTSTGDSNASQNLSRIQEVAPNGAALPAISVTYMLTQSRYFITQTLNGYGGSALQTYQFARGGFRVQTSQHAEAVTGWRDYTYYIYYDETITDTQHINGYSPCFDWLMNDEITGEPLCRIGGYDYSISGTYRLIGYPIVEVQARNPDNPVEWLGVTKHYYKFETWRLGQEFRTRQEGRISAITGAPVEPPIAESWVTWTKQLTTGLPVSVTFGAPSETVEYPDLGNPGIFKRATYAYSPTLQGGAQYGQQTDVWEYDAGALMRHAQTTYSMTLANWTLRKTASKLLDSAGNWVSEQRLYYNTQGKVTFAQDLGDSGGSLTRDTAIGYDNLGNVISQTVFTTTGTVGNPSANGRSGSATTYAYDAKFGYYVYTTTNAGNQSVVDYYYGVNETTPLAGQPFGALKAAVDVNGNQTSYYYDSFGRLRKIAQPGATQSNPSEEYQYYDGVQTDDGTLTQTVGVTTGGANPLLVVHLVYGGAGTHFANSGVAAWERTFYDGLGRVIETQTSGADGAGNKDKLAYTLYDGQGRAYAQSVPYFTSPYVYTTTVVSGVTKVQNPYQAPDLSQPRTTTQHDVLGRVVGASGPDGETTTTSYLTGGDANGAQTTLSIDPLYHRRASVSDLLGRVTAVREYTATPWIREAETLDGVAVEFLGYTTTNAVVTKPPPVTVGPTENFIYGPGLDLPAPVAAPGQLVQFRLAISDTAGADAYVANINVHDVISGDVVALRWLRRSEFRGGLTNFTEFALPFDTTGRLGHGLELRVWWAGNSQMAVDRTTLYWSDAVSQTTRYRYDAQDKLTSVTDALSNTTVITYDSLGRKTAMRDPDMGAWAYGYDTNGNLITQTDALSQTLWFRYDALNRLTEKRLSGGDGTLLAQYGYDQGANGVGRRTSISNTNAATVWTYDARGRVAIEEKTLTGVTGTFASLLQYDDANRLIWTRLPNGEIVTATYNAAGQAQGLYAGSMGLVTGATYNALGLSQVLSFGNGVTTTYTYRSDNFRLQRIQVGANLLDRQYGYDAVGNITSINDAVNGENQSFAYDPLDRLTGVSGAYTETYSYNAIGNMTGKAGVTYSYTDTAHKHAVTSLSDGSSFQYDANGNMVVRIEKGVVYTQTWDINNRLVEVVSGTQHTQYYYDADGQRVKRVTPQGTTWYVSADYEVTGSAPVQTVTVPATYTHKLYLPVIANSTPPVNLAPARVTYRFNGQQVAVREGVTLTFVHGDHLGSASLVTCITGTVVSELRYTPYGETRYSTGNTPNDKRFTGQRQDGSLYDFGPRFYDPQIGRFISADSIVPRPGDPQAYNRYSYSRNSPETRVDPDGHSDICNKTLYNCVDYGSDDAYVTSPTPAMVPGVTNGTPYPLLEANVANPNDLHPLAEQWVKTHPYYDPFADPKRFSTNWMGEVVPNSMFDFVRTGLMKQLLKHGRQQEADSLQGSTVDSLIQLAGSGIYVFGTAMTYGPTGLVGAVGVPHGNSYSSSKLTTLYALIAQKTGELLKWGITSEAIPEQRYTRRFMYDKYMVYIDYGTRVDMAARERTLTSSFPGPLNHEAWAGTAPWSEVP